MLTHASDPMFVTSRFRSHHPQGQGGMAEQANFDSLDTQTGHAAVNRLADSGLSPWAFPPQAVDCLNSASSLDYL